MVDKDERNRSAEFRRMTGQQKISLIDELRQIARNNLVNDVDPRKDLYVKQAHSMAEKAGLVPYIKEP